MINSVLEILKPLDETNDFAIVGYHGNPQPVLWSFPTGNHLLPATAENLELATSFRNGVRFLLPAGDCKKRAGSFAQILPTREFLLVIPSGVRGADSAKLQIQQAVPLTAGAHYALSE